MTLLVLVFLLFEGPGLDASDQNLSMPVGLLTNDQIRAQLDSGLTTTFLFRLRLDGDESVARLDIRFEPWDEIYLLHLTADGYEQRLRHENFQALATWWQQPFLPLAKPVDRRAILILELYPFSHTEQTGARRWLAGEPVDGGQDDASRDSSRVMTALLATSIRREPMRRFRWKIEPRTGKTHQGN